MSQADLENAEELETEEIEEVEDVELELDDDGNPVEKEELPLFMQEIDEDDEPTSSDTVPLKTLLKLKGQRKDDKAEIVTLRQEIDALKQQKPAPQELKRPRLADFDGDEELHEDALEKYDQQRDANRDSMVEAQHSNQATVARLDEAVETFNGRAEKLVVKHKIDPATYADAISSVRGVLEAAYPTLGEASYSQFILHLEEGDEATMFTIGRSKKQLELLAQTFRDDSTGTKALRHIARLTERNLGAKPKTSKAPKPAAQANGDLQPLPGKEGAWKKKYDKATGQERYNIKQQAKKAGVDTSKF